MYLTLQTLSPPGGGRHPTQPAKTSAALLWPKCLHEPTTAAMLLLSSWGFDHLGEPLPGMRAMSRSISSGFERLPIASHPETRTRAKLRTSSQIHIACHTLSDFVRFRQILPGYVRGCEISARPRPLCKTFARCPCAGPSPRALVHDPSQGPMCRTHACKPGAHVQDPCLQARGPCASCCCYAAAAATPKQEQGTRSIFRPYDES